MDDLGAVMVTALFYTETTNTPALVTAAVMLGLLVQASAQVLERKMHLPSAYTVIPVSVGIAGCTWVAIKFALISLPQGLNFKHLVGVGLIGGIGFTMSILNCV